MKALGLLVLVGMYCAGYTGVMVPVALLLCFWRDLAGLAQEAYIDILAAYRPSQSARAAHRRFVEWR